MCLLPNLRVFSSPYFEHDAFMHHAIYVLDAPVCQLVKVVLPCLRSRGPRWLCPQLRAINKAICLRNCCDEIFEVRQIEVSHTRETRVQWLSSLFNAAASKWNLYISETTAVIYDHDIFGNGGLFFEVVRANWGKIWWKKLLTLRRRSKSAQVGYN